MLRAGIVGLPNVGKSTLFNALTRSRKAQAANYPFCTIEPNTGILTVPDPRLQTLAALSRSQKIIPAIIEIVDIAGLVRGASQGEGLGNQFLSHIREVDAIVHVVRCFTDENIHHVSGTINPISDIETITTELILADLASIQKRIERNQKKFRAGDPEAKAEQPILEKLLHHLNQNQPALTLPLSNEESTIAKRFFLLTTKPTLFACNVAENDLAHAHQNPHVRAVQEYVKHHHHASTVTISAQIESDLIDLSEPEQRDYLASLGVAESGCDTLIRAIYALLGLRTYFTTGEKETRAWTIHAGDKAPQAAGVIHSDFERGFIAAETVSYQDLVTLGSFAKAREAGKLRIEGKEYTVQDGDVIEFRFNV